MKKIIFTTLFIECLFYYLAQDSIAHNWRYVNAGKHEVTSIRAADKAPFTKTNINKDRN